MFRRAAVTTSAACEAGACVQGDDTPNVQRKRGLLQSEGVVFTSDGARVSAACLVGPAVLEAAGAPA